MFFSLFGKECRQMLKSVIYYVYVVILVIFYLTQLGTFNSLEKPEPGLESYGISYSEDKQVIMESALGALAQDIEVGSFSTYPIGFYKNVKPDERELNSLKGIVQEVSGMTWEEVLDQFEKEEQEAVKQYEQGIRMYGNDIKLPVSGSLTYDRFLDLMKEADEILGGGSSYQPDSVGRLAVEPATYEDALKSYEEILKQDQVTGAYAREFSDYMGLMMGILPVFLAVARSLKDRRAKAEGVIWSRKVSSAAIVGSRYLATLVMGILPLILLAVSMHLQSSYCAQTLGIQGDALAFAKYLGGWILPTMLITLSVGFLVTEMTDSPLAILIQGAFWYLSTMVALGSGSLQYFGNNFIPRWNSFGNTAEFFAHLPELVANRLTCTGAAVVLFCLTIVIYDCKRKGVWQIHGKLSGHRKG